MILFFVSCAFFVAGIVFNILGVVSPVLSVTETTIDYNGTDYWIVTEKIDFKPKEICLELTDVIKNFNSSSSSSAAAIPPVIPSDSSSAPKTSLSSSSSSSDGHSTRRVVLQASPIPPKPPVGESTCYGYCDTFLINSVPPKHRDEFFTELCNQKSIRSIVKIIAWIGFGIVVAAFIFFVVIQFLEATRLMATIPAMFALVGVLAGAASFLIYLFSDSSFRKKVEDSFIVSKNSLGLSTIFMIVSFPLNLIGTIIASLLAFVTSFNVTLNLDKLLSVSIILSFPPKYSTNLFSSK